MDKRVKYFNVIALLIAMVFISSCKQFFNPDQEIDITEDKLFNDWYEYRSVAMGLYGLQQQLAEQLLVLGELRADLLTVTPNADADLVEINNFNVSKTNKYASPTNFFKLISACNNFIRILEKKHPEILDRSSAISNYDRLYGEALCMRAWAYFTAVKIYGKVPFIYESLTTIEEIENYVNSSSIYIDSVYIDFSIDGYHNDTTLNKPDTLVKNMYDMDLVVDHFTNELETKVKAVGVEYDKDKPDPTWKLTVWSPYAMDALLGTMYLTQGNLIKAENHFKKIIENATPNNRYEITDVFANDRWPNIFSSIDETEHIYVLWFNKANFQQNQFQSLFETRAPHKYMLKPTGVAIKKWESSFSGQEYPQVNSNQQAARARMGRRGMPGDDSRGYQSSFVYTYSGQELDYDSWKTMLILKSRGDFRTASLIMDGMDTVVYKYSIGKTVYDQDANFIIYRAAGIQLYEAEIVAYLLKDYFHDGTLITSTPVALGIVNDGSNYDDNSGREQLGIRGRVGLGNTQDKIKIDNFVFSHNPITNEINGYRNLTNNLPAKQRLLEELILEERAMELAFEGERFYDLIRVAKRRNDPSFLANIVSSKFPAGQRDQIYNYLLDENNWYINYFE
jgi:hypothetical protein